MDVYSLKVQRTAISNCLKCLWRPDFQIFLFLWTFLSGGLGASLMLLSPRSRISSVGMKPTWQVLTYIVMTAVMAASKAAGEKGHPCIALKCPLTKLGAPLTNEREEWGGQESCEPASLGPRTLLFVRLLFGLLLRSDRRHLKNNLMHGCFPPPLSFSTVLAFFFLPLSLGPYHQRLCREERGVDDGKKAEGSQGV